MPFSLNQYAPVDYYFAGCVLLGAPSSLLVRNKNDCAPGEPVRTKDSFGHLFDERARRCGY